jgi:hypothetical protein
MTNHDTSEVLNTQEISVRLAPGDRITLYEDVDKDYDNSGTFIGAASSILFEGRVETMNPKTGLIEFEAGSRTEDIGRAELREYIEDCAGVEILHRNSA